jgi:hypothetical protein
LSPIWRPIAGGVNLNRRIDELIRGPGFAIGEMETEYLSGPQDAT